MALIRWEPVREISSIQNEMNRLFNSFFDTPTAARGNGVSAPGRRWIPAMDLVENETDYVLKADLPGLSDEDVSIEVDDNVLTISGERKAEHEERKEGYYRVERSYGRFSRSVTLPDGVDPEAVKASFEHGVLEVHVPKPEAKKPRKVEINVGTAPTAIEGAESTETA
jgi:HSP20 family protein